MVYQYIFTNCKMWSFFKYMLLCSNYTEWRKYLPNKITTTKAVIGVSILELRVPNFLLPILLEKCGSTGIPDSFMLSVCSEILKLIEMFI